MTQEWEGGKIERTAKDKTDLHDFQKSRKDVQERVSIEAAARRSGLNGCRMMILGGLLGFTPLFVDPKNVPVYLVVIAFVAITVLIFIGNHKIHKADEVLYGKRK